jgi:hypothetical protein
VPGLSVGFISSRQVDAALSVILTGLIDLALFMVCEPQKSIFEHEVLSGVGEDLVAMSHVQVDHAVFRVGPDDGDISRGERVLETEGIVGRVQGDQNLHVLIEARTGLPDVPLVRGGGEAGGQMPGDRTCRVVYVEDGWKGWPVVAVEDASAEEVDEPGPVRVVVVVGGDMESKPAAAAAHVLLEGCALGRGLGKIVQPYDDLNGFQTGGIEVVPVRRRLEVEVVRGPCGGEEVKSLLGEDDMIVFHVGGIKREDVEGWLLRGSLAGCGKSRECQCEQDADREGVREETRCL